MRTWAWIGLAGGLLGALGSAHAEDAALKRGLHDATPTVKAAADGWSYCKSREKGAGILLRIEAEGREPEDREPVADVMAIRYIPKQNFGKHQSLGIDGADRNRAYVRFDLSGLPDNATLTLRLATLRGNKPLSKPLVVGIYPALEPWQESVLSWARQPRLPQEPVLTFTMRNDDGWNEVDVTALTSKPETSEHGWLLRAKDPIGPIKNANPGTRQSTDPLTRGPRDPKKGTVGAADGYSWFRQREHGAGMHLRVGQADGTSTDRLPTADALLIQYIPDRSFGGHVSGALDGAAQNQVLVRFDRKGLDKARKVVLRLAMLAGPNPLEKPMPVGIYRVLDPWKEYGVSWTNKPAIDPEPLQTFDLPPDDGWVEVDVTAMLKRGAPFEHGWLLRAAQPVEKTSSPVVSKGKTATWRKSVLGLVPWAPTVRAALKQAKAQDRLVLTLLRASYSEPAENAMEDIFLATVFADPSVHALISEHFVPYRTFQRGWTYTVGQALAKDPLAPLGIASHRTKPLALLVSSPDGKVLRRLEGIGTFDSGLVRAFLGGQTPDQDDAERRHYTAGAQARGAQQTEHFEKIAKDSPWQWKLQAWKLWPERMAQYERVTPAVFSGHARDGSTEVTPGALPDTQIIEHGLANLIALQRPDGSWGNPAGYATQDSAVTALAATALRRHIKPDDLAGKGSQVFGLRRASRWIEDLAKNADPASLNAWGGAYLVDHFVGQAPTKGPTRLQAQRMVEILQQGQLKSGAWSYDLSFGENWRGGFSGWPKTTKGRAHSMNTGPALISLAEAKAAGLKVSEKVLDNGVKALLAMRDSPAVFTYTWPEPRNFNTLEQSIGRACCCEHALFLLGKNKPEDLELAIATFMKHRQDFWKIAKVTAGWSPPRAISSYFCLFAYYHAARAIRALGGEQQTPRLALIRQDVLDHVEVDGTWLDYENIGKGYGTAMGLLLLDLTDLARK